MSTRYRKVIDYLAYWRHHAQLQGGDRQLRDPMEVFHEVFPGHASGAADKVSADADKALAQYIQESIRSAHSSGELDAIVRQLDLGHLDPKQLKILLQKAHDGSLSVDHFMPKPVIITMNWDAHMELPPPPPKAIGLLKAFRWFCDGDSREIVDLVLADLTRDIKKMTAEGHGRGFIRAVVWRHVGGTLGSITWNAFNRLLKRVATTLGLIKQISK